MIDASPKNILKDHTQYIPGKGKGQNKNYHPKGTGREQR